jgi:hypothetical protein
MRRQRALERRGIGGAWLSPRDLPINSPTRSPSPDAANICIIWPHLCYSINSARVRRLEMRIHLAQDKTAIRTGVSRRGPREHKAVTESPYQRVISSLGRSNAYPLHYLCDCFMVAMSIRLKTVPRDAAPAHEAFSYPITRLPQCTSS